MHSKYSQLVSQNMELIQKIVFENFSLGITKLSRMVGEHLIIKNHKGEIKDRTSRQILYNLEKRGFLTLPAKKIRAIPSQKKINIFESTNLIYAGDVSQFKQRLHIKPALSTYHKNMWNYYVDKYHYLTKHNMIGRTLKQIVYIDDIPVGLIGWASPAISLEKRDIYLLNQGFNIKEIIDNGINNSRMLILPWTKISNLCSHLISNSFLKAQQYYSEIYNVNIFWADTFVDPELFLGTIYRASNWEFVGCTKGYNKKGFSQIEHGHKKYIFIKLDVKR